MPLQLAKPALQLAMPHTDAVQSVVALAAVQGMPQALQFDGSVAVLVRHPFGLPVQFSKGGVQLKEHVFVVASQNGLAFM